MKRRPKAKKVDVLSALLQAVSARYDDAGDKTKAGIVLSCLGIAGERSTWYGSVCRYETGPDGKSIISKATAMGPTVSDCVTLLAASWYSSCAVDPGVRVTQLQLDKALEPARKKAEAKNAKTMARHKRFTKQALKAAARGRAPKYADENGVASPRRY